MIKRALRRILRQFGYDIQRIPAGDPPPAAVGEAVSFPPLEPIWPLPLRTDISRDEIVARFAQDNLWHYAFEFKGGLSFPARHLHAGPVEDDPRRALQRFRHLMPALLASQNGSIKGKRVLDIACSSGFFSLQCALQGANVIGFDARPESIAQANFLKRITGADNVDFRVMDFWDMRPEKFDGQFDIVLSLGILYHLPSPLKALALTRSMARDVILLDTLVHSSQEPVVRLQWEDPADIRLAATSGVVAFPSRNALYLIFRHLGFADWLEIPMRSQDLPIDYLGNNRGCWLIRV